jgi:putative oxidoreductase
MMIILFLIGRLILGGYFVMSGMRHFTHLEMMSGYAKSKGTPAPSVAIVGTGILLVSGGLSFLLAIWPFIGGILLVIFLLGVSFKIHDFWAVADPQAKMNEMVNFTKNMALLGAILIIMTYPGPWPYSL